jgi:hypothetical protein
LLEVMSTCNLHQLIDKPTRITPKSISCLDHFWTDRPELYHDCGVLSYSFSDHSLAYVVRKHNKSSKGNFKYINARSYQKV